MDVQRQAEARASGSNVQRRSAPLVKKGAAKLLLSARRCKKPPYNAHLRPVNCAFSATFAYPGYRSFCDTLLRAGYAQTYLG